MIAALQPRLVLPVLLGLACMGTTIFILQELDRANATRLASNEHSEDAAAQIPLPSLEAPEVLAIQVFAEVLERPVFVSSRRPFQPEPEPVVAPAPEPEVAIELAGIVIIANDRFALLQVDGQEQLRKVREGDAVGGWTVLEIASGGLRMERNGRTRDLPLDYRGHGMGQSPPAIPAPTIAQ